MATLEEFKERLGDLGLDPSQTQSDNPISKTLEDFLNTLVSDMRQKLDDKGKTDSGALRQEITVTPIRVEGATWSVEITMPDYAKFVDQGVQGTTNSINSTSPFRFKFSKPSKKHIKAMSNWWRGKGISSLSHQYALTTILKKRGTRPTNFITDVATLDKWQQLARNIEKAVGKSISFSTTI